jgi:hypothetical protein
MRSCRARAFARPHFRDIDGALEGRERGTAGRDCWTARSADSEILCTPLPRFFSSPPGARVRLARGVALGAEAG